MTWKLQLSLESNNYVYYSANSYFLPMCLFRNHFCLCTTRTGKQQKLCCLGKQMIPGVLLRSISHRLHPQPLGDTYTSGQGEDLLGPYWGPLPSLTLCPCKAHVTTKTPPPETQRCWNTSDTALLQPVGLPAPVLDCKTSVVPS